MKSRHPFFHWLLMIMTLGQYAFVWIFLLAQDANFLAGEGRIPVKKHARLFGLFWSIYLIGFIYTTTLTSVEALAQAPSYILNAMMFLASGLLCYFFWLVINVANELRSAGIQRIPSSSALFGYSLLYFSSLPLLQDRLNKSAKGR